MEIKCKLCGGRLLFKEDSYSTTCDSCGIGQFIFDYLDKDSEDFDEQVEIIKSEKEEFENRYFEYADDVINAESYCLTSKDFGEIICFFEQCGEYKDAPALLSLAKRYFILKVSSVSDCAIALKYIEEMHDLTYEERETQKQFVSNSAISFTLAELKEKGFVVDLPKKHSAENILSVMCKLIKAAAKNADSLTVLERDLIAHYLDEGVEYLRSNCANAIEEAQKKEIVCEIKNCIPKLKKVFAQLQAWEIEDALDRKLQELDARDKLAEAELLLKSKQENARKRVKNVCLFIILIVAVLGAVAAAIHKNNEYSPKNITIEVLSKANETFNDEKASGSVGSGYFYSFDFELTNDGLKDIKLIRGDLEIVNKQGRILSTSSLVMRCDLKANSSIMQVIQLNVEKGPSARELWNTELEDMTISFRIREIHFKNGPQKIYSDTKSTTIYPK